MPTPAFVLSHAAGMKSIGIGPQGTILLHLADKVVDAVDKITLEMITGLCDPMPQNHVVDFGAAAVCLNA